MIDDYDYYDEEYDGDYESPIRCEECGERVDELNDRIYKLDGAIVCENCLDKYIEENILDIDDMIEFLDNREDDLWEIYLEERYRITPDYETMDSDLLNLLKEGVKRRVESDKVLNRKREFKYLKNFIKEQLRHYDEYLEYFDIEYEVVG